jgi:hypothetical protein
MFAPEGITIFHNHGSQPIPAQAGFGTDVLLDKFLYRFQRREFVAVRA